MSSAQRPCGRASWQDRQTDRAHVLHVTGLDEMTKVLLFAGGRKGEPSVSLVNVDRNRATMREVSAALCEDDVFEGTTSVLMTIQSSRAQSNLLELL